MYNFRNSQNIAYVGVCSKNYKFFMHFLIVLIERENVNSKYWNKWRRVLRTEWNSNINEDTIKGIKLPGKITNKGAGEIHTEFISYSCKKLKIITEGSYLQKLF